MFVGEEPFLPLTLVGFEEGAITGACRHEVGDVHELEGTGSEGQVGVVVLDGQINARAMDQVGNQDILQHIHIVFAPVETHHHQLGKQAMQVGQQSFLFSLNGWLSEHEPLAKRAAAVAPATGDRLHGKTRDRLPLLLGRRRR